MKIIAVVDFDGTLCENKWSDIGKLPAERMRCYKEACDAAGVAV